MISSIVIYLNEDDAGRGFYKFAQSLNRLPSNATRAQKDVFSTNEVSAIHQFYRSSNCSVFPPLSPLPLHHDRSGGAPI